MKICCNHPIVDPLTGAPSTCGYPQDRTELLKGCNKCGQLNYVESQLTDEEKAAIAAQKKKLGK